MCAMAQQQQQLQQQPQHQGPPALEFSLLDSNDLKQASKMKVLIVDYLNTIPEPWMVHGLVDFYMESNSMRALSILTSVREPHHKHLFDKMQEYMKGAHRLQTVMLLSHVVGKQPPWLHKVVCSHSLLLTLLKCLKTEVDVGVLLCGILLIATLLPAVPTLIGPYMTHIFEIFCRVAAWIPKNQGGVPEIHVLHVHVGLYSLFHRLYGMFPCSFLTYLRYFYGKEENASVHREIIMPMLERVRMHPALVTLSKETEMSKERWYRMDAHDILSECAKLSLDTMEGPSETLDLAHDSKKHGDAKRLYRLPISLDDKDLLGESQSILVQAAGCDESLWSPSAVCEMASPPPSSLRSRTGSVSDGRSTHPQPEHSSNVEVSTTTTPRNKLRPISVETSDEGAVASSSRQKIDFTEQSSKQADVKRRTFVSKALTAASKSSPTGGSTEPLSAPETPRLNEKAEPWTGRTSAQAESLLRTVGTTATVATVAAVTMTTKTTAAAVSDATQPDNSMVTVNNLPDVIEKLSMDRRSDLEDRELGAFDREVSELVSQGVAETIQQCRVREEGISSLDLDNSGSLLCFSQATNSMPDIKTVPRQGAVTSFELAERPKKESESSESVEEGEVTGDTLTSWEGAVDFMRKVNRIRFYSHCVPEVSDIVMMAEKPAPRRRWRSCSALDEGSNEKSDSEHQQTHDTVVSEIPCLLCKKVTKTISLVTTTSTAFTAVYSQTAISDAKTSAASAPAEDGAAAAATTTTSRTMVDDGDDTTSVYVQPVMSTARDRTGREFPFYTTLPPAELLDRHVQLAHSTHAKELSKLSLTSKSSTDWTHFGGAPPAEELQVLRTQQLLLHNQLMFERHRRDLHGQRNRRLLRRANASVAMEEKVVAMKDQVHLQECEIISLKKELRSVRSELREVKDAKEEQKTQQQVQMQAYIRQKDQYFEATKELENEIKTKHTEINMLNKELQNTQAKLFTAEHRLEMIEGEVALNNTLKARTIELSKQLLLSGELLEKYQQRVEEEGASPCAELPASLIGSYTHEINALKRKLKVTESQLEAKNTRLVELEAALGKKDLIITEQKRSLEHSKSLDKGKIQALEGKYQAMKAIAARFEEHILQLYNRLDSQTTQEVPGAGHAATMKAGAARFAPPPPAHESQHRRNREQLQRSQTMPNSETMGPPVERGAAPPDSSRLLSLSAVSPDASRRVQHRSEPSSHGGGRARGAVMPDVSAAREQDAGSKRRSLQDVGKS
ncbi:PREDICTED: hamartin-like [Priapulus caudatus]|uniref:Hamartin-like n=1 Tax=Priapulus caudatus TaxID=37621 RepID=A0ABM1ELV0_PRICU|nr:PREDICTED: hamartin-like [Priapulus caudatus]